MVKCPFCGSEKNSPLRGGWHRCGDCSLGFPEHYIAPDDLAHSDEDRQSVWLDSQKTIYNDGLKHIESIIGRKGKLLDIGCGHGYFMRLAIEKGWQCDGIEISEPAIRQARDVYKLSIFDKPLQALNLPDSSYDVVTLWRVLDLLPDPKGELSRIYKLLKPGGIVYLRVNNFAYHYPAFRLGQLSLLAKLGIRPGVIHRYGVNSKALKTVLAGRGFKNIHVWNSRLTSGDPYGSGGPMGKYLVSLAKILLFAYWQAVSALTFGKILLSSSIMAWAKKTER